MEHHRPLGYRGMVATLAPAIEKGMTRKNCMAAHEEVGLHPFTRKSIMTAHIASSKGKTVKTRALNYDAIDYDKPVKPQVAHQLGPGGRMTTGKICYFPLTHENNIKLFEALDAEKKLKLDGAAARKRVKAGTAKEGDEDLAQQLSELEGGEFVAKLKAAREREAAGTMYYDQGRCQFFENKKSPSSHCWRERRGDPTPHRAPPKKRNGPAKRMRKAMAMTVMALMTRKRKMMAKTS